VRVCVCGYAASAISYAIATICYIFASHSYGKPANTNNDPHAYASSANSHIDINPDANTNSCPNDGVHERRSLYLMVAWRVFQPSI